MKAKFKKSLKQILLIILLSGMFIQGIFIWHADAWDDATYVKQQESMPSSPKGRLVSTTPLGYMITAADTSDLTLGNTIFIYNQEEMIGVVAEVIDNPTIMALVHIKDLIVGDEYQTNDILQLKYSRSDLHKRGVFVPLETLDGNHRDYLNAEADVQSEAIKANCPTVYESERDRRTLDDTLSEYKSDDNLEIAEKESGIESTPGRTAEVQSDTSSESDQSQMIFQEECYEEVEDMPWEWDLEDKPRNRICGHKVSSEFVIVQFCEPPDISYFVKFKIPPQYK